MCRVLLLRCGWLKVLTNSFDRSICVETKVTELPASLNSSWKTIEKEYTAKLKTVLILINGSLNFYAWITYLFCHNGFHTRNGNSPGETRCQNQRVGNRKYGT